MLTIKNFEKVKGQPINKNWEIYSVSDNTTISKCEYYFSLTNVGHYKNKSWSITLDRNMWANEEYRLYCKTDGMEYEQFIGSELIKEQAMFLMYMELLISKTER